ncbi:MAG: F0F1 ATP synthase subunit delta [Pseudomonadota bacterium]
MPDADNPLRGPPPAAAHCERLVVAESSVSNAGVAERYATALFDLALQRNAIESVETDVNALASAIDDSDDLKTMLESPLFSREAQGKAIAALGQAMGLGVLTANTLAVMAAKRRLFVTRDMLTLFRRRVAEYRGEITAEVVAARPLSDQQQGALAERLKTATGRDVKLDITVDDSIIGGLVVRVGSRMIDTSIRSQLTRLQNTMKEAG